MAGQHPLADVAAIGDPDALRQPRPEPDFDAYGGELDPLEGPPLVAHQAREFGGEGGVVHMENFRAVERIGQGFEAVSLRRLDLGKVAQEGFVHHVTGGVHELSNANCHGGPPKPRRTGARGHEQEI